MNVAKGLQPAQSGRGSSKSAMQSLCYFGYERPTFNVEPKSKKHRAAWCGDFSVLRRFRSAAIPLPLLGCGPPPEYFLAKHAKSAKKSELFVFKPEVLEFLGVLCVFARENKAFGLRQNQYESGVEPPPLQGFRPRPESVKSTSLDYSCFYE